MGFKFLEISFGITVLISVGGFLLKLRMKDGGTVSCQWRNQQLLYQPFQLKQTIIPTSHTPADD